MKHTWVTVSVFAGASLPIEHIFICLAIAKQPQHQRISHLQSRRRWLTGSVRGIVRLWADNSIY